MDYRGFSIVQICGTWRVRVSSDIDWLAVSLEDARRQIDEYLIKKKEL